MQEIIFYDPLTFKVSEKRTTRRWLWKSSGLMWRQLKVAGKLAGKFWISYLWWTHRCTTANIHARKLIFGTQFDDSIVSWLVQEKFLASSALVSSVQALPEPVRHTGYDEHRVLAWFLKNNFSTNHLPLVLSKSDQNDGFWMIPSWLLIFLFKLVDSSAVNSSHSAKNDVSGLILGIWYENNIFMDFASNFFFYLIRKNPNFWSLPEAARQIPGIAHHFSLNKFPR